MPKATDSFCIEWDYVPKKKNPLFFFFLHFFFSLLVKWINYTYHLLENRKTWFGCESCSKELVCVIWFESWRQSQIQPLIQMKTKVPGKLWCSRYGGLLLVVFYSTLHLWLHFLSQDLLQSLSNFWLWLSKHNVLFEIFK